MAHYLKIATIALAGLAATACASGPREMARSEAISLANSAPSVAASRAHETTGLALITSGDRWTGANMLEKAVDGYGDISSRFNLATAYMQTGRYAEAANLYRGLTNDGQFVWATTRRDVRNQLPPRRFNIADESARRLALIEGRTTFASASGAVAAGAFGTPVAAVVGVPATSGRISDAEALRRDGIQ
ncbi:hypothetical protein [Phenylobacterium sp.]|jgi:hypothetical protein|uniref:hypothetical protein n=1 Tax=Phenylobacterium sp. TaxID=1871053 RepID=UPI002F930A68